MSSEAAGPTAQDPPQRKLFRADALEWLETFEVLDGAVITSIPDFSEVGMAPADYKPWFIQAAAKIMARLRKEPAEPAIFYQSDCKIGEGGMCEEWLDKSGLLHIAAVQTGCKLLFHKIMLISPVGSVKFGRPGYTHLLCFTSNPSYSFDSCEMGHFPDVCDRGEMVWKRAMGLSAAFHCVKFARDVTRSKVIIDPFCGKGTVLAVANHLGLAAVGVDICLSRVNNARKLDGSTLFDAKGNPCWRANNRELNGRPRQQVPRKVKRARRAEVAAAAAQTSTPAALSISSTSSSTGASAGSTFNPETAAPGAARTTSRRRLAHGMGTSIKLVLLLAGIVLARQYASKLR